VQKENITTQLDLVDLRLLDLLQQNSKQTIKELAAQLNLSQTPVHERIKRLEQTGVIRRYVALLDIDKVGKPVIVYCNVSLSQHTPEALSMFSDKVRALKEVIECYYISGSYDYLLKVITSDIKEYQRFILSNLSVIPNVGQIQSQFVMSNIKYSTAISLEHQAD